MAKRIKVKGKAPRGLSKAQRIKIAPLQRKRNEIVNSERKRVDPGDVSESTLDAIDRYDSMIDEIAERPDISSKPSSTRKKRVKEGNRKFIGPRQFKSELLEDEDARSRTGGIVLFDNDGDPEPVWMEGKQYADKPNKRRTPLERALRRTQRRQIDLGMEPVDGIEYVPENLRKLIRAKIKGRSSQDRMFRVLARALKKRGGQPSTTDMNRDYDKAYKLGQTDYPF